MTLLSLTLKCQHTFITPFLYAYPAGLVSVPWTDSPLSSFKAFAFACPWPGMLTAQGFAWLPSFQPWSLRSLCHQLRSSSLTKLEKTPLSYMSIFYHPTFFSFHKTYKFFQTTNTRPSTWHVEYLRYTCWTKERRSWGAVFYGKDGKFASSQPGTRGNTWKHKELCLCPTSSIY